MIEHVQAGVDSAAPFLCDLGLRVLVVTTALWMVLKMARRAGAAWRHHLWLGLLAAVWVLPPAILLLPQKALIEKEVAVKADDVRAAALSEPRKDLEIRATDLKSDPPRVPTESATSEIRPRRITAQADPVDFDDDKPLPAVGADRALMATSKGSGVATETSPSSDEDRGSDLEVAASTPSKDLSWLPQSLVWLWALGVLAGFLRLGLTRWRLSRYLAEGAPAPRALRLLGRRLEKRLGLRAEVQWLRSPRVAGPALVGWWRPRVLLPEHLADKSDAESLVPLFWHELVHVKRRDALVQGLAELTRTIYWFVPAIWAAHRGIRREREILTDAAVVDDLDARGAYAEGLLEVVKGGAAPRLAMALGFGDDGEKALMKRLDLILEGGGPEWRPLPRSRRWMTALGVAAGVLLVSLFTTQVSLKSVEAAVTEPAPVASSAGTQGDFVDLEVRFPAPSAAGASDPADVVVGGKIRPRKEWGKALVEFSQGTRRSGRSTPRLQIKIHPDRRFADVSEMLDLAASAAVGIKAFQLQLVADGESFGVASWTKIKAPRDWRAKARRDEFVTLSLDEKGKGSERRVSCHIDGQFVAEDRGNQADLWKAADVVVRSAEILRPDAAWVLEAGSCDARTVLEIAAKIRAISPVPPLFAPIVGEDPKSFVTMDVELPEADLRRRLERARKWVFDHQDDQGRFRLSAEDEKASVSLKLGRHALAMLALLPASSAQRDADEESALRQGLDLLIEAQTEDGDFDSTKSLGWTYALPITTLVLLEAHDQGMDPRCKLAAERAVKRILQIQNPYRAWRYGQMDGDNDTSVTAWMMKALLAAQRSGIKVAPRSLEWGAGWLDEMTDESGRTGYLRRGGGPIRNAAMSKSHPESASESMTAAALDIYYSIPSEKVRERRKAQLKASAGLLAAKLPLRSVALGSVDYYYWFWGTEATARIGGGLEKIWRAAVSTALAESQNDNGAFRPDGPWARDGGQVYTTSLGVMMLHRLLR